MFLFNVMPAAIERLLRDLAGGFAVEGAEIDEQQMVVGAARHEPEPFGREARGERFRVLHDLGGVLAEARMRGFVERDCLRHDDVLERATLQTREHGLVDRGGVLGLRDDAATTRAAQRLVVVKVTTSEYGTGDGCAPPAMRPAMCAASKRNSAPTSSAISRNGWASMIRGYAVAPVMIIFGRSASEVADLVEVDALVRRVRP